MLTTSEITTLRTLCRDCHRAGPRYEKDIARAKLADWLQEKLRLGVSARKLADAAGVSEGTIQRWATRPASATEPRPPEPKIYPRSLPRENDRTSELTFIRAEAYEWQQFDRFPISQVQYERIEAHETFHRIRDIHVLTGDETSNGNRFGLEVEAIRQYFPPQRWVEHSNVAPDDLARRIRANPTRIVHVAFHSVASAIALTRHIGRTGWVSYSAVARTISRTPAPQLLVLNGCSGCDVARNLSTWAQAVIYWPGVTDDQQAIDYATSLYRGLTQGDTLQQAHEAAKLVLNDDASPPVCLGKGDWTLKE